MSLCEFVRQALHTLCKGGLAAECLEFFCCLLLCRPVTKKLQNLKLQFKRSLRLTIQLDRIADLNTDYIAAAHHLQSTLVCSAMYLELTITDALLGRRCSKSILGSRDPSFLYPQADVLQHFLQAISTFTSCPSIYPKIHMYSLNNVQCIW